MNRPHGLSDVRQTPDERIDAIEQLAVRIAHDLNNLLGIVSNSAHLIGRHPDAAAGTTPPAGPLAAPLAAIDRAVQRGRELTQQLQGLARQADQPPGTPSARTTPPPWPPRPPGSAQGPLPPPGPRP